MAASITMTASAFILWRSEPLCTFATLDSSCLKKQWIIVAQKVYMAERLCILGNTCFDVTPVSEVECEV